VLRAADSFYCPGSAGPEQQELTINAVKFASGTGRISKQQPHDPMVEPIVAAERADYKSGRRNICSLQDVMGGRLMQRRIVSATLSTTMSCPCKGSGSTQNGEHSAALLCLRRQ